MQPVTAAGDHGQRLALFVGAAEEGLTLDFQFVALASGKRNDFVDWVRKRPNEARFNGSGLEAAQKQHPGLLVAVHAADIGEEIEHDKQGHDGLEDAEAGAQSFCERLIRGVERLLGQFRIAMPVMIMIIVMIMIVQMMMVVVLMQNQSFFNAVSASNFWPGTVPTLSGGTAPGTTRAPAGSSKTSHGGSGESKTSVVRSLRPSATERSLSRKIRSSGCLLNSL